MVSLVPLYSLPNAFTAAPAVVPAELTASTAATDIHCPSSPHVQAACLPTSDTAVTAHFGTGG